MHHATPGGVVEMRSFLLTVLLLAIALALTCAGGGHETVELHCLDENASQPVTWYWYEGTSRAGVLHPARAMSNDDPADSIPGVSGYEVNETKSTLTLKFDRCDVTVDLQCTYLDGKNALRGYMFKVSGCVAYSAEGLLSPAPLELNRTGHADAEEFTFRCFGDDEARYGAPPASWYWNPVDPAPEDVHAHGRHNYALTLRLNSCNVTVDIQCLAYDLRGYSVWTHFRLENCRQFETGVTHELSYTVLARGQFWSLDRLVNLQCPDAHPDHTQRAEWIRWSPLAGETSTFGGEAVSSMLPDHRANVSNRYAVTVHLDTCDHRPVKFQCELDRPGFISTTCWVTVRYCKVFQSITTNIAQRNTQSVDLRCGDPRPEKALHVLWYRERGGGTRPVKPNSTLPGVSEHGVDLFTGELRLVFADCNETLYLQCALNGSGFEESRRRYGVRNCTASYLGFAGSPESGGGTDPDRVNASHVRLRCPGANENDTINVLWVPEGNWTLPVVARPKDSTGEIALASEVCDRGLRFLQCVHIRRGAGAVRHRFQLNGCDASYLGEVRDQVTRAPSGRDPKNASSLTLRCPHEGLEKTPVTEWFWQQGRNTYPVRSPEVNPARNDRVATPGVSSHRVDKSTGDLTLIFHRCDLTAVFHCIIPAIGKVNSFTVRNCTWPADGKKGHASIPASSSSERTRFWLVVLVSAAVFAGYPIS